MAASTEEDTVEALISPYLSKAMKEMIKSLAIPLVLGSIPLFVKGCPNKLLLKVNVTILSLLLVLYVIGNIRMINTLRKRPNPTEPISPLAKKIMAFYAISTILIAYLAYKNFKGLKCVK